MKINLFGELKKTTSTDIITAFVQRRGINLGTWTGTSYEYSEVIKSLKNTDITLVKKP